MTLQKIVLLVTLLYSSFSLCVAQDCSAVTKIEAKDGVGYLGIVEVPPGRETDSTNIFLFFFGKSIVKSDTSYQLNFGKNAFLTPGSAKSPGVVLHFSDGSTIAKPGQPVDSMAFPNNRVMLSTFELALRSDEVRKMKNNPLTNIVLDGSDTLIAEPLRISIQKVIDCLLRM